MELISDSSEDKYKLNDISYLLSLKRLKQIKT